MANPAESTDNVYVNVVINNPIDDTTRLPLWKEGCYEATFPTPILVDPRKYYASIVRFSLPINCVPLTIFPLNTAAGQTNANLSNLLIGIQVGGNNYDQYVVYNSPNNLTPPAVSPPFTSFSFTQASSPYYFLYSIQQLLTMINTALNAAFVAAGSPGGGAAPYYIYDSKSQLFSLIVTSAFLGASAKIYMNGALQTYFISFPFTTQNDPNKGPNLFFHDLSNLPYGQSSPYMFTEEFVSVNMWLDARRILVTTNSIPISTESAPNATPLTFNPAGLDTALPIISDYILSFNNVADISSLITYIPSAQYRLADLLSSGQLNRINLHFYWVSETGIQQPLLISPGTSITVKIGFFKKELYKHLRI